MSGWPISYNELAKYYAKSCAYSLCGSPDFSAWSALCNSQDGIVPGLPDDQVLSTSLERWSLPTRYWKTYKGSLCQSKNITVLADTTCTHIDFEHNKNEVSSLTVSTLNGKKKSVKAKLYVLACGGLESTRLMLNSDTAHFGGVGNHSGKLGRYYMGHISGKISRVHFSTPAENTIYGFEKDREGIYCRRRFTLSGHAQKERGLLNFAAWLDNPPLYDPTHDNGILSIAYLALSTPLLGRYLAPEAIVKGATGNKKANNNYWKHVRNVVSDIQSICTFIPPFLYRHYFAKRKIPGFFLYDKNNAYALHYHAEHAPAYESRVYLSNNCDELGLRRLVVDMKYNQVTVDSVVRCHRLLDEHLRRYQCGKLVYMYEDLASEVSRQASDGFHQIGTTRMSTLPEDGVVDPNCRVHGIANLYVSSSSVFPTSGQANPTLTIMALSIRLAEHLKKALRS